MVTTTLLGQSATRPLLPKTPKRAARSTRRVRPRQTGVRATVRRSKRRGGFSRRSDPNSPENLRFLATGGAITRRTSGAAKGAVKIDNLAVNHNFSVKQTLEAQRLGQSQRRKKRRGVRAKVRKQVKKRKQIRTRSFLI